MVAPIKAPLDKPCTIQSEDIEIQKKFTVLKLADGVGNVVEASRLSSVSRDTIYRRPKLIEQGGVEVLQHQETPNLHHKNRTDKAIE